MDFEIQFTDITLLESNGEYEAVCKIMEKEAERTGSIGKSKDWMIRSKLTILSPFGFSMMVCHFYNNGKVYIADYMPSSKDIHSTDVRCLTYWCNNFGWKTPEPLLTVIDSWPVFWKKEWETYIIDSEYFDKKFGVRKDIQFDNTPNIDDNEEEE
mgnify:FL=1